MSRKEDKSVYKNLIIAALAAVLIIRSVPDLAACEPQVQAAVFIGFFIPLLFFCFFCDNFAGKWRDRERDKRQIAEYIRSLR